MTVPSNEEASVLGFDRAYINQESPVTSKMKPNL